MVFLVDRALAGLPKLDAINPTAPAAKNSARREVLPVMRTDAWLDTLFNIPTSRMCSQVYLDECLELLIVSVFLWTIQSITPCRRFKWASYYLHITFSIAVALISEIPLSAAHSISDESNLAHGH
jgi:hypothetical protein